MSYTVKNLKDVEDVAGKHGLGEIGQARFAREDLNATDTGLSHQHLRPGKRQQFAHRHDQAEEIYVVLSGSGQVKLDEEIVQIAQMDALRVAPAVTRCFQAGPDGLELLVFGAHHAGDGEMIPGWWSD